MMLRPKAGLEVRDSGVSGARSPWKVALVRCFYELPAVESCPCAPATRSSYYFSVVAVSWHKCQKFFWRTGLRK